MSINKKNLLGHTPDELGTKDALHVAIVSVRAAQYITPGARCSLNEHREAKPDAKGFGVADPFLKKDIKTGQSFWLLMDEVPTVSHHWDHPTVDFTPPTREPKYNATLLSYANGFGVTYQQLMDACEKVAETERAVPYPGNKTEEEFEEFVNNEFENYDLWSYWADEVKYEFYNNGSECCPEYDYPDSLFKFEKK